MLSLGLLRLLGARSSWRILNLVAELQAEKAKGSTGRRRFLGLVGASALTLGLSGIPSAATAATPQPSPEKTAEIERELTGRPEVMEARRQIKAGGFTLDTGQTVVTTDSHADYLAMTFFPHTQNPENQAACLIHDYDGETRSTSIEFLRRRDDSIETDFACIIPNSPLDRISPRGAKEYGDCIAMCVGANCAAKANKCLALRNMAAVLACMTAVCGSKVKVCHRICKKEW